MELDTVFASEDSFSLTPLLDNFDKHADGRLSQAKTIGAALFELQQTTMLDERHRQRNSFLPMRAWS